MWRQLVLLLLHHGGVAAAAQCPKALRRLQGRRALERLLHVALGRQELAARGLHALHRDVELLLLQAMVRVVGAGLSHPAQGDERVTARRAAPRKDLGALDHPRGELLAHVLRREARRGRRRLRRLGRRW